MTPSLKTSEQDFLSDPQAEAARTAGEQLSRLNGKRAVHVFAQGDDGMQQSFALPAYAVRLLTDILGYLAEGREVSVMAEDAALTTNQAADVLNVSRPHLIKLLTDGAMPYSMVGSHRRVLLRDLLAYQRRQAAVSEAAADQVVAQAQDLKMGY